MNSQVSIIRCNSYNSSLVEKSVREAVGLLGGITRFVRPGSKVLVKPNLLMAKEPEFGIDTHPEVVRAVARILKEIDCRIILGDGPSVWGQIEDVNEVYEKSGMKKVAVEEGITLVKFEHKRWRTDFPLTTWLDECDQVVSLAKFKTHDFTVLTGAIKNLYGLIPGTYKTELHKKCCAPEDFARILAEIYAEVKPALTIVDGIIAMEGDGPGTAGKLRETNLLFAGGDCVALDSVLALVMGLAPEDILSTKEAARRGLGTADINQIEVLGEKLEDVIGEPFKLPGTSLLKKIPRPVLELAGKLIRFYPEVDQHSCIRCESCIKACPKKVISMRGDKIAIKYSGCISCFCCQEACPANAIKVRKSILAKLIGL